MGQPKLLLPWSGTTVLAQVVRNFLSSPVTSVIVVARPDDSEVAREARQAGALVVQPAISPPQMKDSILCGLEFVKETFRPDEADVWLLSPADLPGLAPDLIAKVLDVHDPASPQLLAPAYRGKRGHPVLLPWSLAQAVAALGPDEGLNVFWKRFPGRVFEVDDPRILADLDTPEDYERLRPRET